MRGYTLIELLVALVIVSVLATSIALALPDPQPARQAESIRAWHREAQTLATRAMADGRALAWEVGVVEAQVIDEVSRAPLPLAAGLQVAALDVEGQRRSLPARIAFTDVPESFVVVIRTTDDERGWQIVGRPSGAVDRVAFP